MVDSTQWSIGASQTYVIPEVFPTVLNRLHDILLSRLELQSKVLGDYLSVVSGQRWYVSHDAGTMGRLWDQIRTNADLTDFVIEVTRELSLKCSELLNDNTLCGYLSDRLFDSLEMFADEESVIDTDTLKQIVPDEIRQDSSSNDTSTRLNGNVWLMVMEITPMCGILDTIRKRAEKAANAKAAIRTKHVSDEE